MKLVLLTLLLLLYSVFYTIMVDWMAGNRLTASLRLVMNPFRLMTLPEYGVVAILLIGLAAFFAITARNGAPSKSGRA
ncbi:hypothetical protein J19TS2_47690 [Cohnella xylanilytica]|uniref:Uncharacterized protein n=1 Tax=Cohnella xylanilytica TaxID=557555 RepID=A0A841U6M4_9BACL|nr:hypothetical protein [Cohnella xylanilytica]MBB6693681.1 hypothetical protein [Cohnella xylanilytica]GIO15214.1 hypothetical protein J19TS2_47690 [Cohnella xylanilytica]